MLSTEEQSYLDKRPMKRLTFDGINDLYLHPLFGAYSIKQCIEKEAIKLPTPICYPKEIPVNDAGVGKYAIINLRKLESMCNNPPTLGRWTPDVRRALSTLEKAGALEWGCTGEQGKSPESPRLVPVCTDDAMASLADKARRIAACIAACDGISTETLEAAGVDHQFWPIDLARNSRKGLISLLGIQNFTVQGLKKEVESSSRKKLKARRDELLRLLKDCESALTLVERETGLSYGATVNARAAIADAEGG